MVHQHAHMFILSSDFIVALILLGAHYHALCIYVTRAYIECIEPRLAIMVYCLKLVCKANIANGTEELWQCVA